ncbi:MAG: 50S ribosomal protein L23 [Kiritimatiellae bacterium]|nr:50S ribosomal protein L23 [Kiritimatiellia bacterium]
MTKSAHTVVKNLLLTEKGTRLTEQGNQYLFRVAGHANKLDVKRAVEELFKVHVVKVNTMNRRGKKKRERTWTYGRTSGWKRAVVTLKAGETIDLT